MLFETIAAWHRHHDIAALYLVAALVAELPAATICPQDRSTTRTSPAYGISLNFCYIGSLQSEVARQQDAAAGTTANGWQDVALVKPIPTEMNKD